MAKPAWASVSPSSGSGNGTVDVSATAHTGRTNRSGNVTFSASGCSNEVVAVTQLATPEFVIIDNKSVSKNGETFTVTGKSNAAELTFTLGSQSGGTAAQNTLTLSLPASYTAGGLTTNNGAAISGDPGATTEYSFSISFTVGANAGVTDLYRQLIVTTDNSVTATALITQAAADPILSVSPSTLTLNADGDADTVTVTSNTNWTVS